MGSRFDFQSPGAAFTGEIVKVLAERKAEERQRLLDSLSFSADQRAQEAAARDAERQKADLASQKQRDEIQRVDALGNPLSIDEDPGNRGYSPEDIDLLKRYGRVKEVPVPQVSSSITSMTDETGIPTEDFTPEQAAPVKAQTRLGYVGSETERERQRRAIQSGNTIASMLSSGDPRKVKNAEAAALIMNLNNGELPDQFQSLLMPDVPLTIFDEPTGSTRSAGTVPANGKVITTGWGPAAMYRDPATRFYPTAGGFVEITDKGPKLHTTDISGSPISGGRASTTADKFNIPVGVQTRVQEAAEALGSDPRSVDEDSLAMFRTRVAMGMSSINGISDGARSIATAYVNNPQAALARAEAMLANGQLTEKDIDDITALVDAFVPAHVKEMLTENPYAPNAKKEDRPWWRLFDEK